MPGPVTGHDIQTSLLIPKMIEKRMLHSTHEIMKHSWQIMGSPRAQVTFTQNMLLSGGFFLSALVNVHLEGLCNSSTHPSVHPSLAPWASTGSPRRPFRR